jgi:type II secretion system protein I
MRHRPTSHRIRRGSGFTLIEAMAALVIFSVAIVAVIEGMGAALRIQSDLTAEQRAAMLAENVIEEIKYTATLDEGEEGGQYEGSDAAYGWDTAIAKTDVDNLMEVTARVTWGPPGNEQVYGITTLIYAAPESTSGGAGAPDRANRGGNERGSE